MNLKKLGILGYFDTMSNTESVEFAHAVEKLGYSVLWVPETFGRDPFVMATHLLGATNEIVIGTAIVNVWKREAMATGAAARTIGELFDGSLYPGAWRQRGTVHDPQRPQVCEAGHVHARVPGRHQNGSIQGAAAAP